MSKYFATSIAVAKTDIPLIVDSLGQELANNIVALCAVKFAHWNVKGEGFYPTHKLFDKIYDSVEDAVDLIAERIVALGGTAFGLTSQVINVSTLAEYGADAEDDVQKHTGAVRDVLAELCIGLRGCATSAGGQKDLSTQNRILNILQDYEQQIYFLEGSLR